MPGFSDVPLVADLAWNSCAQLATPFGAPKGRGIRNRNGGRTDQRQRWRRLSGFCQVEYTAVPFHPGQAPGPWPFSIIRTVCRIHIRPCPSLCSPKNEPFLRSRARKGGTAGEAPDESNKFCGTLTSALATRQSEAGGIFHRQTFGRPRRSGGPIRQQTEQTFVAATVGIGRRR